MLWTLTRMDTTATVEFKTKCMISDISRKSRQDIRQEGSESQDQE